MTRLLAATAAVLCTAPAIAQLRADRTETAPPALHRFADRVVEFPAPSAVALRGRYAVYVPKDYDAPAQSDRRYPWAIWLDGERQTERFRWHGAPVLDALRDGGGLPDMIVVVPDSPDGSQTGWMNGSPAGDLEDVITQDLRRHVRQHFRVSDARNDCALLGTGLGGLAALRIAIEDPEAIGAVAVSASPALPAAPADLRSPPWQRAMPAARALFGEALGGRRWDENVPLALLAGRKAAELEGLRIYFDAEAGGYAFRDLNRAQSAELERLGVPHTFELHDVPIEDRMRSVFRVAMPHALAFVASGFTTSGGTVRPEDGIRPPGAASGRE